MQAFRQFRSYPLQSVLIVLAIALGVAVVTAVAAVFQSNNASQAFQRDQLWNRELRMQSKKNDWNAFYQGTKPLPVREVGLLEDESVTLTKEDLQRAKDASPSVPYAYLMSFWIYKLMVRDGTIADMDILLVTTDYARAAKLEVSSGSLPIASDYEQENNVIVLSSRDIKKLKIEGEPVGQTITVTEGAKTGRFTVVGVLKEPRDRSDFNYSFVPYATPEWGGGAPTELLFAVDEVSQLGAAREELAAFARENWGERVTVSSNNFDGSSQQRLIAIVIATFASTALAAASLNIMNLMLARVLKRSHDIGVQRTLGASRASIVQGFLAEVVLLGILGGLLGVLAGYGLLQVYNAYLLQFYGDQNAFPAPFSPLAAMLGFAVALGVSLLFGLYPALQASRVRIIEALRGI
jgi:putative ABC transport system permease protein